MTADLLHELDARNPHTAYTHTHARGVALCAPVIEIMRRSAPAALLLLMLLMHALLLQQFASETIKVIILHMGACVCARACVRVFVCVYTAFVSLHAYGVCVCASMLRFNGRVIM